MTSIYGTPSMQYLPSVKPSAIALGTVFTHAANLALTSPLFGEAYQKAMRADSKSEFARSSEAAKSVAAWGSTLFGSGVQTYAVAALLGHSNGAMSYKGAAYIGGLVFAVTAVPDVVTMAVRDKRGGEYVLARVAAGMLETVGLAMVLTWWGIQPAHDLV